MRSPMLFLALMGAGCGSEMDSPPVAGAARPSGAYLAAPAAPTRVPAMLEQASTRKPAGNLDGQEAPSPRSASGVAGLSRKIIYDAQIDLAVDDLDPVTRKVTGMVQEAGGYIAEQNMEGSPGSRRLVRWKIRVAADRFESFAEKIVALGELERSSRTSQDVTEQFYDIEARIRNKKAEEQTLTKILQERSGKLEDVLKVEVELSRVRGEIEQFEGRIRVLENLSQLATLTLSIRERDKFLPPAPTVADFPTQISRTWAASLQRLLDLGKVLILLIVDWALWLPVIGLVAWIVWFAASRLVRTLIRNREGLLGLARTRLTGPRPPHGQA